MTTFVCINNLSDLSKDLESPKKFIKKRLSGEMISGLFFYSNAVNEFLNEARLTEWLTTPRLKIYLYTLVEILL